MSQRNQTETENHFSARLLPWLLGVVMLVIYLATLNQWVTLANILPVAKVSGFLWQPEVLNPLLYLFTSPFRLLPVSAVPVALNIFSAICAALTLVLLARSVAILPHDRTQDERLREKSGFSYLTVGTAWFPPLLAVLMFGLQFGFWQSATSFTGESLDLLFYATIIWLLLEYRLDEREGRLTLAAFLYGVALTENWALVGLLPVFITFIIWLKKLDFFNFRFLSKMALCGLVGMLFFFVLPIMGSLTNDAGATFWQLLKPAWQTDWQVIKSITNSSVRHNLLLVSVTTFLPVLVMSIRWSASFGDSSHVGRTLATQMFHVIHAVIFGVCIWVMFDPPFSPHQLALNTFQWPFYGSEALTFYYLSALAIGYYCGYFLLVFGRKTLASRWNPKRESALPGLLKPLTPVIYWGTLGVAAFMAFALIYKNLPLIHSANDTTLKRYADLVIGSLPAKSGILLSDSEGVTSSQQTRSLLIQAELAQLGRAKNYLVVDTKSLNWAPYLRFLHKQNPDVWPKTVGDKDQGAVNPLGLIGVLNLLSKSNTICYLNPSFGYYFEVFYQEPHGLVYQMKTLPETTLLPPPLSTNLIGENQKFWATTMATEFPRIEKVLTPYDRAQNMNPANWLIMHLHGKADPNPNALFVASVYSLGLNDWGVALQRAGQLTNAADCFVNAKKINPDNIVAGINLDFNKVLQSGEPVTIDPARVNYDQFGKFRNWNTLMSANGPFDDPSYVFVYGLSLVKDNAFFRQALAQFNRLYQLAPDFLPVRLTLAQLYLYNRLPDQASSVLQAPLQNPGHFGLNQTNSTELNVLASAAYFQKNEVLKGTRLLEQEIARHPDNETLMMSAAQAFLMRRLYTNALDVIDQQLVRTPDSLQWLFGKGYANLQMSNYVVAVNAFTRVLEVSTNDPMSRFYRGYAYLQNNQLNEAKADYEALKSSYTNAFQIAYGLGEIAWRQHNTNEAISNYETFLDTAPTNTLEIPIARERLKELRGN